MTNWIKPAWYLTPQEFADIIVESLENNNSFKRNEKAHPVDIEAAFSTTASAIATAIDAIGKKMHEESIRTVSEKHAMMQAKDLRKTDINISTSDNLTFSESTVTIPKSDIDYLETKYGKFTK